MRRLGTGVLVLASTLVLLAPTKASAQSGIAGLVTDSTGAVLPGVSVEAASPVLIEKVRSAVTNAQGRYDIIDLRPGPYTVTFTLIGFSVVKREGINLPANVTATVNAELRVGGVEETVTVSGAAPVVDVTSVTGTQVLSKALLEALPSQHDLFGAGGLIPGVTLADADVGGQRMMQHSSGALVVHGLTGGTDNSIQVDGMNVNTQQSDGSVQMYHNDALFEEYAYSTSALPADVSGGGLRQNMIPKQGGNTFAGAAYVGVTPGSWISQNIPPDLYAKGLRSVTSTQHLYDSNISEGGRIVRDKLWFFAALQYRTGNDIVAGVFDEFTGKPAVLDQFIVNPSARLTLQVTPKNKLSAYYDRALKDKGHDSGFGVEFPTASQRRPWRNGLYYVGQAKWTSTMTNHALLEVGHSSVYEDHLITCQPGNNQTRGTPQWYATASRVDLNTGVTTTSCAGGSHPEFPRRYQESGALSYVTGSHNFKVGIQYGWGSDNMGKDVNADLVQQYRDGVPDTVVVFPSPVHDKPIVKADMGIYAQDAWQVSRLSLNVGVRFEHFNSENPQITLPAGRFVPARVIPAQKDLPNWNDVAPRFGVTYDVFGDGKTAIKAGVSKYMQQWTGGYARTYSAVNFSASDTRNWSDCAYLPGTSTCDPALIGAPGYHDGIAQDNEIGPSNIQNFGVAANRQPAPGISRGYSMEYFASAQHELLPGLAVTAGWYHRNWYNLTNSLNLAVSLSDYASFQTPNPLTGELITIYNLNKVKQGLTNILDSNSKINARAYDGFELSATARLPKGGTALGGWNTERTVGTTCDVSDPNLFRFCDQSGKLHQDLGSNATMPFRANYKLAVNYQMPLSVGASMSFQSFAGAAQTMTVSGVVLYCPCWSVPTALFPGGRTQSVTVSLASPGTHFFNRRNELDLGLRRTFRANTVQIVPALEVFNALNSKVVLTQNQSFGSSLGQPQSTLLGRTIRLSVNVKF